MALNYSLTVFQEPRGMMRILQFIFAICAFATTANFSVDVNVACVGPTPIQHVHHLDYPFRFDERACARNVTTAVPLSADVSSDAQFFVATGVLSMLYCVFIIAVYAYLDELYRSKPELPLADFMITTILAIFWLSGSAAWSNGASALKRVTDAESLRQLCGAALCQVVTGSFSRLNISLLLGYLNFFLWASDLWFLYKETIWFHGRQPPVGGGDMMHQQPQQQQQQPQQYIPQQQQQQQQYNQQQQLPHQSAPGDFGGGSTSGYTPSM